MPVGAGDRFFRLALDCFRYQTYEGPLEIVILDNSVEPIEHLLPCDPHIKYARSDRLTIGALRNRGNSLATGDVIVHFDEDDWYSDDRIAAQVERLQVTGKAATGWHSLLFFDTSDGRCYRYVYAGAGPYGTGTSLCYTRAWWAKHSFNAAIKKGEDYWFQLDAAQAGQLDSTDARQLCVMRAHMDSTCPPTFCSSQFPTVAPEALPDEFWRAVAPAAP